MSKLIVGNVDRKFIDNMAAVMREPRIYDQPQVSSLWGLPVVREDANRAGTVVDGIGVIGGLAGFDKRPSIRFRFFQLTWRVRSAIRERCSR